MTELQIQHCERCNAHLFPDRLWCPDCPATELRHRPAGPGRVEEETTMHHPRSTAPQAEPVRLGTVRLQSGPLVIARLAAEAVTGTQVRLDRTPTGAIWAHATPD